MHEDSGQRARADSKLLGLPLQRGMVRFVKADRNSSGHRRKLHHSDAKRCASHQRSQPGNARAACARHRHRVTVSYMSRGRQFSARLDPAVLDRLERRGARAGINKSRLAERYLDEGMRMEDHPGVAFRDGPGGRRAGLAGGPDVWEVIATIRASGLEGEAALDAIADWGSLTGVQVRAAVRYYAEYRDEIDERIRRHFEEADAAEEQWRREQDALA